MGLVKRKPWNARKLNQALTDVKSVHKIAVPRAMRREMRWAATRVIREVASGDNIRPQSLVRSRVKIWVKDRGSRISAGVSVLVNPIPMSRLAGVKDTGVSHGMMRTGRGVVVPGRDTFPTAFMAKGLGGKVMVFRRQGKERLPLTALKIPITSSAMRAATKWVNAAMPRVTAEIKRQMALRKVSASDVQSDVVSD